MEVHTIATFVGRTIRFAIFMGFCVRFRSRIATVFRILVSPIACVARWIFHNSIRVLVAYLTILILHRMGGILYILPEVAVALLELLLDLFAPPSGLIWGIHCAVVIALLYAYLWRRYHDKLARIALEQANAATDMLPPAETAPVRASSYTTRRATSTIPWATACNPTACQPDSVRAGAHSPLHLLPNNVHAATRSR